jgi:senataxin
LSSFKGEYNSALLRRSVLTEAHSPPGTGKTSTICGLVRRFISQRPTPINVPEKQATLPKAKILICAPSNAAIDEIASRLISLPKKINVVRTGAENGMNASVKSVSLDRLVMEKIEAKTGMQGNSVDETNKELRNLRMELDSLKHLRQEKLKELTNLPENTPQRAAVQQQAQNLGSRQREIQKKFNDLKDKSRSDNRTFDSLRRQMRKEVFEEADVVCSTLSGSGHESLLDQDFEMVIIDEAAQSIELSSLIPLKFNCTRCVMVGDPQQLPPTVISQDVSL